VGLAVAEGMVGRTVGDAVAAGFCEGEGVGIGEGRGSFWLVPM
jgi:hypothetical protein